MSRRSVILIVLALIVVLSFSFFLYRLNSYKPFKWEENHFTLHPLDDMRRINIMPNWFTDSEFAGYYFADKYGFYEELNIELEIIDFDFNYDAPSSLAVGSLDFAIMSQTKFVSSCKNGRDFVVLMALFQSEPSVFIVKSNSNIFRPVDFKGKSIVRKNDDWERNIERVISSADLLLSDVKLIDGGKDISPFFNGEVDIWCGYAQDEPIEIEMAGVSVRVIHAYDYGLSDYQGLLVTTRKMVENEPRMIEAFLGATLRGWIEAIKNPELAVEALYEQDSTLSIAFLRNSFNTLIPYIHNGEMPLGLIDMNRWKKSMGANNLDSHENTASSFIETLHYGKRR